MPTKEGWMTPEEHDEFRAEFYKVTPESMSEANYKRFRRLLTNFEGHDPGAVVNNRTEAARRQRLKMRKAILDFRDKHGDPHPYLAMSGQDYANYCMVVNG